MVALNLFVSPEVKNRIDTYGATANMPIWAIVEAAILAGKPGANGIPEGWDLPGQPSLDLDSNDDKELPINSP